MPQGNIVVECYVSKTALCKQAHLNQALPVFKTSNRVSGLFWFGPDLSGLKK